MANATRSSSKSCDLKPSSMKSSEATTSGKQKSVNRRIADVGLFWIQCDMCSRWEMYENSGLLPILGPYDETKVRNHPFTCMFCELKDKVELIGKIDELISENLSLKNQLKVINETHTKQINEMKSYAETLKNDISAQLCTQPSPELSSNQLQQCSSEVAEQEKRKLNLVVFGLPECPNEMSAFIQRANSQLPAEQCLSNRDFITADRLGKPPANNLPRLLRLKCKDAAVRRKLLTMHRNPINSVPLGATGNPQIFIRPDLTKAQLEIDNKLRAELLRLGKDNFMIRNGKIIPRDVPLPNFDPASTNSDLSANFPKNNTCLSREPDQTPPPITSTASGAISDQGCPIVSKKPMSSARQRVFTSRKPSIINPSPSDSSSLSPVLELASEIQFPHLPASQNNSRSSALTTANTAAVPLNEDNDLILFSQKTNGDSSSL